MQGRMSTYEDLMEARAEASRLIDVQKERLRSLDCVIQMMFPQAPNDNKEDGVESPVLPPAPKPMPTRVDRVEALMKISEGSVVSAQSVADKIARAEGNENRAYIGSKVSHILGSRPHLYERVGRGRYRYIGAGEEDAAP